MLNVKHDKSSYFQPCRGTTTRGRDGRTAAGLIFYFWHFFRGFAVFLVVIIHNLVAKITSLWIGPFFHLQPFQPWDMPACFHMQEVFQSGLFNKTHLSVSHPSFWFPFPLLSLSQFFLIRRVLDKRSMPKLWAKDVRGKSNIYYIEQRLLLNS